MNTHRPFISIAILFTLGILIHRVYPDIVKLSFLCLFVFLALLFAVVFFSKPKLSNVFLFLAIFLLGGIYYRSYSFHSKQDILHVARFYRKKPVEIEGLVSSEVTRKSFFNGIKQSFVLSVSKIKTKWGWREKRGNILVNIYQDVDLDFKDRIHLLGKLHYPYDFSKDSNFSFKAYLDNRNIKLILSVKKDSPVKWVKKNQQFSIKKFSLMLKKRLKTRLNKYFTENEVGILSAILLGERSGIPAHIRLLFMNTGTAHILAISGLHIGIIAFLFFLFLRLIPFYRKGHYIMTSILIVCYAFLVGMRPSVVRSTIMTVVFMMSFVFEKETDVLNSLAFAALIILFINPKQLFDVGFQLSFISVIGIVCFSPKIYSVLCFKMERSVAKRFKKLVQGFSVSLAAWLAVSGLIAYYFCVISPISIIANLIIIPLMMIVVVLGISFLAVATFVPFFAGVFSLCLKVSLNVMVLIIYFFSKVPGSYFSIKNVTLSAVFLYYVILFLFSCRPLCLKVANLFKGRVKCKFLP